MEYSTLDRKDLLTQIEGDSVDIPQIIFKHSTRCIISKMALKRLTSSELPKPHVLWVLDLLSHRDISQLIAERFNVFHQSPQVIILSKHHVLAHTSHEGIDVDFLNKFL